MTKNAQPRSAVLPNLIVIGAMKCGTTSLHRYLDLHPQIGMSNPKELNFFLEAPDGSWHRGIDWYAAHFDPRLAVRGDASPAYANAPRSAGSAERIAGVVPDARLIYMVRDPLARAVSNWVHATAAGFEAAPLEAALADPESRFVARSLYLTQLREFLRCFPEDRILVIDNEELRSARTETLAATFRFLRVDDGFTDPRFERVWEVSSGKARRYELAYRLSRRFGRGLWSRLPAEARWWIERVAYPPAKEAPAPPAVSPELRERLQERFRPEVEGLRELTGKAFATWSV